MSSAVLGSAYRGVAQCAKSGCQGLVCVVSLLFRKRSKEMIVFHSYTQFIFAWPVIVTGIVFWFTRSWVEGSEYAGWFYITAFFISFLTMGVDLNRNESVFWLLIVVLVWVTSRWLTDAKGLPIMGAIIGYFRNLDVAYNAALAYALSLVLAIVYCLVWIKAILNDRWNVTRNQIGHIVWGRTDRETARGAKGVTFEFPDILELIIMGAGTMRVLSAQGAPLLTIPHVPMLWFRRHKIQKLFESIQVDATTEEEILDDHSGEGGHCDDTHEPPVG